jgi:hypothetical protein
MANGLDRAEDDGTLELARRLVDRLEHLSADSTYAHRASGLRGSLLRTIERIEVGERMSSQEKAQLEELTSYGFEIIELAAKEIGAKRK